MDVLKMIFLVWALFAIGSALAIGEPVAAITDLSGNISYLKDETTDIWAPAKLNMPLFVGDKLNIEANSSVSIFFAVGACITLDYPTTYKIPEKLDDKIPINPALASFWGTLKDKFAKSYSQEKFDKYLGTRAEQLPKLPNGTIISPRSTKILDVAPRFIWVVSESVRTDWKIQIISDNKTLWEGKVRKPEYIIQNSKELLIRGKTYKWRISLTTRFDIGYLDSAIFEVATEEENAVFWNSINSTQTEGATRELFIGIECEKRGYYADALEHFKKYVAMHDNKKEAMMLLCDFYKNRGFPEIAQEEMRKVTQIPDELRDKW